MPVIQCESREQVKSLLSRSWPTVVVMTIKGNLLYRIEILGEETEEAALTDEQRVLRNLSLIHI